MMPMMSMMMIMFRSDPSKQVSFSLNVQFSLDFAQFLVCFPPRFFLVCPVVCFILFLPHTNEKSLLSGNPEETSQWKLRKFPLEWFQGIFSKVFWPLPPYFFASSKLWSWWWKVDLFLAFECEKSSSNSHLLTSSKPCWNCYLKRTQSHDALVECPIFVFCLQTSGACNKSHLHLTSTKLQFSFFKKTEHQQWQPSPAGKHA